MKTFPCPKGHASTEADYCSECGTRIDGADAAGGIHGAGSMLEVESARPDATISAEVCPECGAPREPRDVVFCEICGFNFVTGARGELPSVAPLSQEETAGLAPAGWEVIVTVEPGLREPGSPEVPVGIGPFRFPLEAPASLVGRRSDARAIFPEIALPWDDAVSHRHALLQIDPVGGLLLRDIGSANGTRLNGVEVSPMSDQRLADGDQIALGHWTRVTVRAIP